MRIPDSWAGGGGKEGGREEGRKEGGKGGRGDGLVRDRRRDSNQSPSYGNPLD